MYEHQQNGARKNFVSGGAGGGGGWQKFYYQKTISSLYDIYGYNNVQFLKNM
jgi:hypothetical protein